MNTLTPLPPRPRFQMLNLTIREQNAHDADLLQRIRTAGTGATLADIFEGLKPCWAVESLDRLMIAGKVRERAGVILVIVG